MRLIAIASLKLCVVRRIGTSSLVTPIDYLGRRINLCKTHRRYGGPSYKIRRASINACIIGHRLNPPSSPVVNTRALDFECGLCISCVCVCDTKRERKRRGPFWPALFFSKFRLTSSGPFTTQHNVSLNNRAENHRCSQLKPRTTNYPR